MRRLLSAILLMLLVCGTLSAQETASSYKTRIAELGRALAKNPDNVETLYNLALFYFDNSHPMRSLPQAMRYATLAEQRHSYLLQHDRTSELLKLQRNDITLTSIRQLRGAIADAALAAVQTRSEMSLAEVDEYLELFGGQADMAKLLRARRLGMVYRQTLSQGSGADCYRFVQTYAGTAEAANMEQHLAQLAEERMADMSTEAGIDSLAALYPQSRAVRSVAQKYKSRLAFAAADRVGTLGAYNGFLALYAASDESEAARMRIERLLEKDLAGRTTARQLQQFADSNADSPLADRALAKLRKLIYRTHDVAAARHYVENYQMDPHRSEVYGEYYSWYSVEGNAGPLQLFSDQNPDFPFQRALENDLDIGYLVDKVDLTRPYADSAYAEYAGYVRDFTGKPVAIVPLQRMLQQPYATRNYTGAAAVVKDMENRFDNNYRGQYEALLQLLSTPTPTLHLRTELADSVPVRHPCLNEADGMLYFSDGSQLCRAVQKGKTWTVADTVTLAGGTSTGLSLFGFFNRGKGMLLGYDGDIWIAERDGDQWRVSDIPPYPVNTDYVETDACMLADGSGMLMVSDRPGGLNCQPSGMNFHGDTALATDLYYVPYTRNGWGTPQNLGLSVNSVYSERSPLLSRNLRTLYYVSDAHTGLGYGDVYVTERTNPDDWTSWTRPRNLGREVNSPWHEEGLSFSPDEKRVYLSSDFGDGHYRAYSFATSHNAASGSRSLTVDVADAASTLVRLQVADLQRQAVTQVLGYEGGDSTLTIRVDKNRRYALLADAGSSFVVATVLGEGARQGYRLPAYTYSELVAMDRELPLPVVGFAEGKAAITQVGAMQLEQLARFAQLHEGCRLEVAVDVAGSDATRCYDLSLQRAEAVRDWLVSCGMRSDEVLLSAYGNSRSKAGEVPGVSIRFRE